MDQNNTNAYSTEIPVEQAEKELHHTPSPLSGPTMTIPTLPPQYSDQRKLPITLIVSGLLIIVSFLAGYIIRGYLSTSSTTPIIAQITPTINPTPTTAPTPTSSIPPLNPMSNRFSSTELGIVFDTAKILQDSGNTSVLTQPNGSRVYVYASGTQASTGQYVDSLSKVSTDTTVVAAQKITASDSRFATCTFEVSPQEIYPVTYERVIPTCPNEIGGGMEYFLTDSLHPTRLLYIKIGQYSLDSASDSRTAWQDTLRFL
jgi:hypothetical protein